MTQTVPFKTLDKWRVTYITPGHQGEKSIFNVTQAIGKYDFAVRMVEYYEKHGHIAVKIVKGTWWKDRPKEEQLELPLEDYVPDADDQPLGL